MPAPTPARFMLDVPTVKSGRSLTWVKCENLSLGASSRSPTEDLGWEYRAICGAKRSTPDLGKGQP